MGFQNKYISEETIHFYLSKGKTLRDLFKNDTLILEDKVSSLVYDLYCEGLSDEEIKNKIYNLKNNMEE